MLGSHFLEFTWTLSCFVLRGWTVHLQGAYPGASRSGTASTCDTFSTVCFQSSEMPWTWMAWTLAIAMIIEDHGPRSDPFTVFFGPPHGIDLAFPYRDDLSDPKAKVLIHIDSLQSRSFQPGRFTFCSGTIEERCHHGADAARNAIRCGVACKEREMVEWP